MFPLRWSPVKFSKFSNSSGIVPSNRFLFNAKSWIPWIWPSSLGILPQRLLKLRSKTFKFWSCPSSAGISPVNFAPHRLRYFREWSYASSFGISPCKSVQRIEIHSNSKSAPKCSESVPSRVTKSSVSPVSRPLELHLKWTPGTLSLLGWQLSAS